MTAEHAGPPIADENSHAERAVLGASLQSPAAFEKCATILSAQDFANPAHSLIWDAISYLNSQGTVFEPVQADPTLVVGRLHQTGHLAAIGGAPYVHTLLSQVVTPANAVWYARMVRDASKNRRVESLGTRLQQSGRAPMSAADRDSLLTEAIAQIEEISAESGLDDPMALLADDLIDTLTALEGSDKTGVTTGLYELDKILGGLTGGQVIVVGARPATGKALALDTPIPTPTGWSTMGALAVGDQVLGMDGKPTSVVFATEVMTGHRVFEVEFSDGEVIVADAEHLWLTCGPETGSDNTTDGITRVCTTTQIADTLTRRDGDVTSFNHRVPRVAPLHLPDASLADDPFVLGTRLGDSVAHNGSPDDGAPTVGVRVPMPYLRASVAQRSALLSGLLASTGAFDELSGRASVFTGSPELADDVLELVRSLGLRPTLHKPKEATFGTSVVSFTAPVRDGQVVRERLGSEFDLAREITRVTEVPSVPARCIQVDNEDHMYLAGRAMVPTHNTVVAQQIATHVARDLNKPALMFCLEMGRQEMLGRLLAAQCGVNSRNLNFARPALTDRDWDLLAKGMSTITDMPLFVNEEPDLTPARLNALIGAFKRKHPDLGVVTVDYLQLMNSGLRTSNRQEEVSFISREIKKIAKRHGVPIVLLSQLNRGSTQRSDSRPQISDLRESGAIEQDSDVVILLHREDQYEAESPRAGEMDFIVAKHRNGETGTAVAFCQLHYYRLTSTSDTHSQRNTESSAAPW